MIADEALIVQASDRCGHSSTGQARFDLCLILQRNIIHNNLIYMV